MPQIQKKLRTLQSQNEISGNDSEVKGNLKVLRTKWDSCENKFHTKLKTVLVNLKQNEFTQWFLLQVAAVIFNPVRLTAPFTSSIKCLLQEIWIPGLDWKEEIPDDKKEKFFSWCSEVEEIQSVSINRNYFCGHFAQKAVHIFFFFMQVPVHIRL